MTSTISAMTWPFCVSEGLSDIGLVGVLIEAKRRGVIPVLRPLLERLVVDAGFRLAPTLQAAVLREVDEF